MFEKAKNHVERLLWAKQGSTDKQVEGSTPQWGLRQNQTELGKLNEKNYKTSCHSALHIVGAQKILDLL